ncbi:MAG: ATP-binding cassette subfamily B protein, partial [Alteromonadaceae bacterium]
MLQTPIYQRSALPGRERWQVTGLKKNEQLANQIHQLLSVNEHILNVVANALTGRVLVLFKPTFFEPGEIGQLIVNALSKSGENSTIVTDSSKSLNNNPLYSIVNQAQQDNKLRNRALRLNLTHSVLKFASPAFLALVISSVLFPIQALTNMGLSKGIQLAVFSGLFGISKLTETKVGHSKNMAWSQYGNEVDKRLSRQVIEHVQALPISYVDEQGSDKLMNMVKNDIATIKRFLAYTPPEFADKAVTTVLSSVILLAISPVAFLMSLIPTPFITKIAKKQKEATTDLIQTTATDAQTYSQLLANNLSGLPTVKSFTAEAQEVEQIDKAKYQANQSKKILDNKNAYYGNLTEIGFMAGIITPLIYGC